MNRLQLLFNMLLLCAASTLLFLLYPALATQEAALLIFLITGIVINIIAAGWSTFLRPEAEDIAILYVYGFTDSYGENNTEQLHSFYDTYVRNLRNYSREVVLTIDDYVWDSAEIKLMGIKLHGLWKLLKYAQSKEHWSIAKKTAIKEGKKLYATKIKKFERNNTPYYIIAYSLGTRIVLEALNLSKRELPSLRGVFFLGSALPLDSTVTSNAQKSCGPIVSYYSPHDTTLGKFYQGIEGSEAGGFAGFNDNRVFLNMETYLDHADYHELINPICNLILYRENSLNLIGSFSRSQTKEPVGGKWNNIYTIPHPADPDSVLNIQYRNNKYRAVDLRHKTAFVAESDNLHLLLKNLSP